MGSVNCSFISYHFSSQIEQENDVDIEEHGITYKQKMKFNQTSGVQTIIVPQHLDIDASTTLILEHLVRLTSTTQM